MKKKRLADKRFSLSTGVWPSGDSPPSGSVILKLHLKSKLSSHPSSIWQESGKPNWHDKEVVEKKHNSFEQVPGVVPAPTQFRRGKGGGRIPRASAGSRRTPSRPLPFVSSAFARKSAQMQLLCRPYVSCRKSRVKAGPLWLQRSAKARIELQVSRQGPEQKIT